MPRANEPLIPGFGIGRHFNHGVSRTEFVDLGGGVATVRADDHGGPAPVAGRIKSPNDRMISASLDTSVEKRGIDDRTCQASAVEVEAKISKMGSRGGDGEHGPVSRGVGMAV